MEQKILATTIAEYREYVDYSLQEKYQCGIGGIIQKFQNTRLL